MQLFFISRRMFLMAPLIIVASLSLWFAWAFKRETLVKPSHQMAPVLIRDSQKRMVPTKNKKMVAFGIDPGHGGIDSGTQWGNLLEKNLNLNFSRKLAEGLKKRGYRVVLTRDKDQLLTPLAHFSNTTLPYKKDDLIRRIQKLETAKVSIIVCIHANWNSLSYHRGPTVYYFAASPQSRKLAEYVQEQLNRVQPFRKLPKPSNYFILQQVKEPAILVELGFFSNQSDRILLQDDVYLDELNNAIINGLEETL